MIRLVILLCLVAALCVAENASANPDSWARQGWASTDFTKHTIDYSEILSGGPPKDGIPSIDNPKFMPASEVDHIAGREPVIRVEVDGDLRAYPLQVLTWHEIVNDTVGGLPVAITYCPLCNAALAFERRVDGQETTFGTTGLLRNSDLVMYDRFSESWWQQFTGEAIVGARTGDRLKMVPVRVVSYADFVSEAPDGQVLVPNNPRARRYGENPYVSYDSRNAPYPFFDGSLPDTIGPMVRVVVVRDNATDPFAVSLPLIREKGEMMFGDVTIAWKGGVSSALDSQRIKEGRDVGTVTVTRKMDDGSLEDIVHDTTFAFAFHAFHPEHEIVTQ